MLNFKHLIEGWFPVQSDYWTCLSLSLALWPWAAINLKVCKPEMERQFGTWALWSLFSCSLLACRATIFSCFLLFLSGWSWGRKCRGHAWTAFHPNIALLPYFTNLPAQDRLIPFIITGGWLLWSRIAGGWFGGKRNQNKFIFNQVKCRFFFFLLETFVMIVIWSQI